MTTLTRDGFCRLKGKWFKLTPAEVRVCEGCGETFPIHDGRQRYCTDRCRWRTQWHRRAS